MTELVNERVSSKEEVRERERERVGGSAVLIEMQSIRTGSGPHVLRSLTHGKGQKNSGF